MTDDRLDYKRTIVTTQRCSTCKRECNYYLIESRDGYVCLECDRRLRMIWRKT